MPSRTLTMLPTWRNRRDPLHLTLAVVLEDSDYAAEKERNGKPTAAVMALRGGEVDGGAVIGNFADRADPEKRLLNLRLWAASSKGLVQEIEPLVLAGGQLNAAYEPPDDERTPIRCTALHFAVRGGHPDCVEELARLGCDMNAVDERDNIALHMAAERGDMEMTRLLVMLGCDMRSTNGMLRNPREIAERWGKTEVGEWLKAQEDELDERDHVCEVSREDPPSDSNSLSDYGTGVPMDYMPGKDIFDDVRREIREDQGSEEEKQIDAELARLRKKVKHLV